MAQNTSLSAQLRALLGRCDAAERIVNEKI